MIYKLELKNSRKYALVSDEAYEQIINNEYFNALGVIENLREHSGGYPVFAKNFSLAKGGYRNETIYLHKYIAEKFLKKPETDSKLFVLFKNGKPLDCRTENLEWVTMPKLRRQMKKNKSTTGYRGVTKIQLNKFRAILYDGSIRYDLGQFETAEEAALAYNKKSIKLFGKTNSLNKIGQPFKQEKEIKRLPNIRNIKHSNNLSTPNPILQLRILLKDSKPEIWRLIRVEKSITFLELHHTIQIAMGWKNYHMFEFTVNDKRIALPNPEIDSYVESSLNAIETKLEDHIKNKETEILYNYDFGDNWQHKIIVENFLPESNRQKYPVCIEGELNCPPEDCGGIKGFYENLGILSTKDNEFYEDTVMWMGKPYKLKSFNRKEINKELSRLKISLRDLKKRNILNVSAHLNTLYSHFMQS